MFLLRERFQQFMYGRYGMDQLNRFLSTAALVLLIITLFLRMPVLDIAALVLLAWCYFRMFSRNTSKRYVENEKFLGFTSRFTGRFQKRGSYGYQKKNFDRKAQWEQRKDYKFFTCPHCSQKVRVPRGKGKICITCPKCRTEFIKRS